MKFIKILNEASSLPLGDLKKAIKKDNKVNQILSKESTWDSIKDKESFIASIKFWFFNNQNVRDYIKSREEVGIIRSYIFDKVKKLKAQDFTSEDFEDMKQFISELFRDFTAVSNLTVSTYAKKELTAFINGNRGYHNLSKSTQNELDSMSSLKPASPIVVYRGLLFSETSLQNRTRYDGTLEKGDGLKFLESIRAGTKIVDLKWDRPSSWSQSKEIADRFAKYGPASSNYAATMQWLRREQQNKFIDGALGFVISTRIQPENVLLDVEKLHNKLQTLHGDEREVILKPGTYTCKIVHRYTTTGEVDVESLDDSKIDMLNSILNKLKDIESFIPDEYLDVAALDIPSYSRAILLKNKAIFKKLASSGSNTVGLHLFDKIMPILHDALLNFEKLEISNFAHAEKLSNIYQSIAKLNARLKDKMQITINDKSQKVEILNLTAEQYRNSISWPELRSFEKEYLVNERISSDDAAALITSIMIAMGKSLELSPAKIKLLGAIKQEKIISNFISEFYDYIGIEMPETKNEQVKLIITILRRAIRNYTIIRLLGQIDKMLKDLISRSS